MNKLPLLPPALTGRFFFTCAIWGAQHFLTFLKKKTERKQTYYYKIQRVEMCHCQMCLERNNILFRVLIVKNCSY